MSDDRQWTRPSLIPRVAETIRRSDGKGAGAILGFVNFLMRIYDDEQPRAVVVGWDSLEAPTNATKCFPPGMTLWLVMAQRAVSRHSLHGPGQHACDWVNRQRAAAARWRREVFRAELPRRS
jgi:hypothetical protein